MKNFTTFKAYLEDMHEVTELAGANPLKEETLNILEKKVGLVHITFQITYGTHSGMRITGAPRA